MAHTHTHTQSMKVHNRYLITMRSFEVNPLEPFYRHGDNGLRIIWDSKAANKGNVRLNERGAIFKRAEK